MINLLSFTKRPKMIELEQKAYEKLFQDPGRERKDGLPDAECFSFPPGGQSQAAEIEQKARKIKIKF